MTQHERQGPAGGSCGQLSAAMLSERVRHLLQVTQSLTRLLDQENQWLRQRRASEIKSLAGEKSRLSALYATELGVIRSHKSQLGGVDKSLRLALKAATEEFHKMLDGNRRLIERLKSVSEGLMQAIGDEIERRKRPVPSYGRDAQIGKTVREPTTLALDAHI
ncbi:MAG: hypothetical protein ACOY99_02805 [Pseudomonadota bacterium]|jgi:flagellar biosynthesis/type III secretory pathway chaperone